MNQHVTGNIKMISLLVLSIPFRNINILSHFEIDYHVVYLLCYATWYYMHSLNALKLFSLFLSDLTCIMTFIVGANYNIPVCLWLMDTHPYNPPMVFVRPTATMQIKQGKHVDANGKIYLPYLHEWKHVSMLWLYFCSFIIACI